MKIAPNTIIEQPPAISDKRSAAHSGNKRCFTGMSLEIPYIHAYHNPKTRKMEPITVRNTPAMAIGFLFNAFTFNHILHNFKLS